MLPVPGKKFSPYLWNDAVITRSVKGGAGRREHRRGSRGNGRGVKGSEKGRAQGQRKGEGSYTLCHMVWVCVVSKGQEKGR
jgi:hypothetical protein